MSLKRSLDDYTDTEYSAKLLTGEPNTPLCQNCMGLKSYIDEKFQRMCEMLQEQHAATMKAIDENCTSIKAETLEKALNSAQEDIRNDATSRSRSDTNCASSLSSILNMFPVLSEEDLVTMDEMISEENEDIFVDAIQSIVRNNLRKNFKSILGKDMILDCNLDGTHGKLKFRDFRNVYYVLKKAIVDDVDGPDADSCIRKAFQYSKRYHYTQISIQRSRKRNSDPLR